MHINKIILALVVLFILPLVMAQEIPTYQQSTNVTLSVPCFINGDVCGVSVTCDASILNPEAVSLYNTESMTKVGTYYEINLTETDTSTVGQYELAISCCQGGNCFDRQLNFQITPSGAAPLSTGQSGILFIVLAVIFFVSIIFFIFGFRSQGIFGKMVGFSGGIVMIFILVLYTMFIINEAISGTPNLVTGYETFLFVIRTIGTVLILSLIVILFLVMAKAWKIKRGIVDK